MEKLQEEQLQKEVESAKDELEEAKNDFKKAQSRKKEVQGLADSDPKYLEELAIAEQKLREEEKDEEEAQAKL